MVAGMRKMWCAASPLLRQGFIWSLQDSWYRNRPQIKAEIKRVPYNCEIKKPQPVLSLSVVCFYTLFPFSCPSQGQINDLNHSTHLLHTPNYIRHIPLFAFRHLHLTTHTHRFIDWHGGGRNTGIDDFVKKTNLEVGVRGYWITVVREKSKLQRAGVTDRRENRGGCMFSTCQFTNYSHFVCYQDNFCF